MGERKGEIQSAKSDVVIPEGAFIVSIDADDDKPSITYAFTDSEDSTTVPMPESIAYYLNKHHCGSMRMRDTALEQGREEIRQGFKSLMRLSV